MFTDAALAIVVDTSIKWLYNASRRLKRPLERSFTGVTWWRLTHHLAGRVGIPLADAARASDLLLRPGAELAKVRLRATTDDAVAISVDLARFLDGTSLAAAASLYLATPKRRGRPPRNRGSLAGRTPSQPTLQTADLAGRLSRTVESVRAASGGDSAGPVVHLLTALASADIPLVIVGAAAAVFHGDAPEASSLDLVADLGPRHARTLGAVLNSLDAVPRGVTTREGFQFDAGIVRAVPCLALRIQGVAVNVLRTVPGIGEFAQVAESSIWAPFNQLSLRVLSRDSLLRTPAALARAGSPA